MSTSSKEAEKSSSFVPGSIWNYLHPWKGIENEVPEEELSPRINAHANGAALTSALVAGMSMAALLSGVCHKEDDDDTEQKSKTRESQQQQQGQPKTFIDDFFPDWGRKLAPPCYVAAALWGLQGLLTATQLNGMLNSLPTHTHRAFVKRFSPAISLCSLSLIPAAGFLMAGLVCSVHAHFDSKSTYVALGLWTWVGGVALAQTGFMLRRGFALRRPIVLPPKK